MIDKGTTLTLDVEKPAAGGRMLARHEGQVVLVWGAIPGERVQARVERAGKGVLYAETVEVITASPDRKAGTIDWRCGGNVYAHVAYARQLTLKGEIIQDAFGRIGRVPLTTRPEVMASPDTGYRMRARLHARGGRLGFFREGTHEICDAASTGQLLPSTHAWIAEAQRLLADARGLDAIEIAENVPGDERAWHLEMHDGAAAPSSAALTASLGEAQYVSDDLHITSGGTPLTLRRHVRAFFQGNRFLLEPLVRHVISLVPQGPVVDLYAGVGLFGLSLAVAGAEKVTLVEGDPTSGADLKANAVPFAGQVRVERRSVEEFLAPAGTKSRAPADPTQKARPTGVTFVIDPPRTGMSKDAIAGIIRARPARIVYVSCDVATLARDTRTLLDAGYELAGVTGIDLFPNTAHVESVALFIV